MENNKLNLVEILKDSKINMNTKLQTCFDAIDNLEIGKLTNKELHWYAAFIYDEHLDIGRELLKRGNPTCD